jgi:hypothetical protein
VTFDSAQRQRAAIAAEKVRLQGVLSVAEFQLATHDAGLKQTPSVSANQSPIIGVCSEKRNQNPEPFFVFSNDRINPDN